MSFILFDVGANHGTDSIEKTKNNTDIITFAFEPTPTLYEKLINETVSIKDRYFVFKVAVSDFNGKSIFNIAGQADWGSSSLNTFVDNIQQTWPNRPDLVATESIEVDVITMENFIENICPVKINQIDFFHCDAQGSDLKVLQGFGKYISIIKEGVVEVPNNNEVKPYKESHTKEDTLKFLYENNFIISNITNQMNEQNLYFKRVE